MRGLASSFASAICSGNLAEPISLELARRQHQAYIDLLHRLLPDGVIELPADDRYPGMCPAWRSIAAALSAAPFAPTFDSSSAS